jgi:hypothetical protein
VLPLPAPATLRRLPDARGGVDWRAERRDTMTLTGSELVKAVVDLVRIAAWPSVVVFLAVKFKPELLSAVSSLLRREVKLDAFGVSASIGAEQQTLVGPPALSETSSSLDPSPREAVNLMEAELRTELKAVDPSKKEATLLRSLAEVRLERGQEAVYNRIFGSQIAFLNKLNEIPNLNLTIDQARDFFKLFADRFPEVYSSYSFEAWLTFMTTNDLIVKRENNLQINWLGRDFLTYISAQRFPENKPWQP